MCVEIIQIADYRPGGENLGDSYREDEDDGLVERLADALPLHVNVQPPHLCALERLKVLVVNIDHRVQLGGCRG